MKKEQYEKNLLVPKGQTDVVLDTDTYNELDDQFALSYMLRSDEKLNIKGIYAAPFVSDTVSSAAEGMIKSYHEINKILNLADRNDLRSIVHKGSEKYLDDEKTSVISDAANDLVRLALEHTPEKPLCVVAIGAITDVASALLIEPKIAENIVIVWLGGNSREYGDNFEYNMRHDIAAARVVFSSGAPIVQLPCYGVVSSFYITKPEFEYWLTGKNKLCDYLRVNTVETVEAYAAGMPWSRIIWDVTAVAWLLNDDDRFMKSRSVNIRMPEYDFTYSDTETDRLMRYVYFIKRDALLKDLFDKLGR